MHEKSHRIIRIPVLLRNEQQVYFHIGNSTKVSFRAELINTELIAWSRLNKDSIKEKNPCYIYLESQIYVFERAEQI